MSNLASDPKWSVLDPSVRPTDPEEYLRERDGSSADDDLVYDPYSPVVTFRVVDPRTAQPVGYGQRGQVVMNHISKGVSLPDNLGWDTAIRVQGLPGLIGDSVSGPRSIETVGGERAIEGIYQELLTKPITA